MGKLSLAIAALLLFSCSSNESVEEYNKKQAALAAKDKPQGKAIKVETAVPGGSVIPCDKLLDAAKLGELLGEKDPVTIADHTKQEIEATSVCSVRRGGEIMGEKEQAEKVKKTLKLGVLAGDELCNIAAFCSIPADAEQLEKQCANDGMIGNKAIGVFACVKVTPKGPDDAYTYKFVDADSKCVLRVRGGPSVNEEAEVQKCAKAALELVGPAALEAATPR